LLSNKLLENKQALCNIVKRIACEAGELTLEFFDESGCGDYEIKDNSSPVTEADLKAELFIEKSLKDITPELYMVGEETIEDGREIPDLGQQEYFWLVDPLDGTKEFISGSGDYTVNIALINKGEPVLGVVYAPYTGELYAGCGEGTATRWLEETNNEKSIKVRKPPSKGITVVASRSHGSADDMQKFLEQYKVEKLTKRGSSLKICIVAAGKADIYPRLGPTCEWDIAAGDAILRSAGGVITDLSGNPMSYGHAERKFLNPKFLAKSQYM
jgi:3'(2'), 5'-bisphosphate nucleotidase